MAVYDVTVVGAGWAGLAAAVSLAQSGRFRRILVVEAGREAGGRARNTILGGVEVDSGQHLLLGAYRQTLHLLEQFHPDLDSALTRYPLQLQLHHPNQPPIVIQPPRLPAPLHLAAALLTAPQLPWRQRWELLRASYHLQRLHYRLPADQPLLSLLRQLQQSPLTITLFWQPLALAILNTPLERASAQLLVTVLRDTFSRDRRDSELLVPTRCLGDLFAKPAVALLRQAGHTVAFSTRVRAIGQLGSGLTLHDGQQIWQSRQVVVATAPHHAAPLLVGLPALHQLSRQLQEWPSHAIATLYLHYPATHQLDYPFIGLNGAPLEWLFDRRFNGLAGVFAGVVSLAERWSRRGLLEAALQQLQQQFPHWPSPLSTQLVIDHRATSAATVEQQRCRPANATPQPQLWLAGDYTAGPYPATLEGAVQSGIATAQQMIDNTPLA